MKGLILSNEEGRAVILTPEGEYRSVKIGQPLMAGELYDGGVVRPWWRYAVAAAVILAVTLGTIDFFSIKAYAQVSDAVELGVNRWGRVVTTRALNDEGAEILKNSDLKGKKVETAIEEITIQTEAEENMGKDQVWKEFPEQAVDKGNRPEGFIERVELNKNQGLLKSQEKSNNSTNNVNNSNKEKINDNSSNKEKTTDNSIDKGSELE